MGRESRCLSNGTDNPRVPPIDRDRYANFDALCLSEQGNWAIVPLGSYSVFKGGGVGTFRWPLPSERKFFFS
jgi:hypothetical protein